MTLGPKPSQTKVPSRSHPQSDTQAEAARRNFALLQVCGAMGNLKKFAFPFLEIWQSEPLQEALRNAETHLRKEIENGKARK